MKAQRLIFLLFTCILCFSLCLEDMLTEEILEQANKAEEDTNKTDTDDSKYNADRKQAAYPDIDPEECFQWPLIDGVCCGSYCDNKESTEGCDECGGAGSEHCVIDDASCCKSGVKDDIRPGDFSDLPQGWHYSRSTHFGITTGGACGFGLYQVCGRNFTYTQDPTSPCYQFCQKYTDLCDDPEGITYRGNFAAPPGHYYSQFWGALEGDRDNYLSCGECFEVIRTKPDGTDYKPDEEGYTKPILLALIDSCPCSANTKWCCGAGYDQCQEVKDWKYGCPIPKDSIHLDLSDPAMARLQTNDPNLMIDGIIPIRYKRVGCPKIGNLYLWLRQGSGPWYLSFTIVNAAGHGSIVICEILDGEGKWIKMARDPNYTSARPQERYGTWVVPQGTGPFNPPLSLRLTDGSGEVLTIEDAIPSFDAPEDSIMGFNYIDLGTNFPEIKTDYTDVDV